MCTVVPSRVMQVRVIRSCGVAAEREAVLVSVGHLRLPRPNIGVSRVAPAPPRSVPDEARLSELCSGWDLRKALQLFARTNGALLEWLNSRLPSARPMTSCARRRPYFAPAELDRRPR